MQTEVLKEFLVISNTLNFRKAAAQLHITQPALSKHIAALEREIGFTLFDRVGATRLTAEGKRFYVYVQRTLDVLEDGIAECRTMATSGKPARVQWSEQESELLEGVLPNVSTPFSIVRPPTNASIFEALTENRADIVITYDIDASTPLSREMDCDRIERVQIGSDRLAILTSRENPIADKGELTTDDIRNVEIMIPYGSLFEHVGTSIQTLFGGSRELKLVQNPTLTDERDLPYCDFTQSVLFGLYDRIHRAQAKQSDLVVFDTVDGKPITAHVYLAFLSDNPNPNVRALANEVLSLAAAAAADG